MMEFIIYTGLFCLVALPILVFITNKQIRKTNTHIEGLNMEVIHLNGFDAIVAIVPIFNLLIILLLIITLITLLSLNKGLDDTLGR